jgi:hypothetical protein
MPEAWADRWLIIGRCHHRMRAGKGWAATGRGVSKGQLVVNDWQSDTRANLVGGRGIYQPRRLARLNESVRDYHRSHLQFCCVAKDPIPPVDPDPVPERVAIGRNIRSIRDWRKLGQEALEEATGVHAVQISRVENGVADTGISTYILLARGLKVPLFWLFTADWPSYIDDGSTPPSPPRVP